MNKVILAKLNQIEQDYNIRILYAVEAGSRAWGYEDPNSDWDIRFIYVHKLPYYVSVQDKKDVIESVSGHFDLSGWELRKALKLLGKGNPSMIEWINSTVVYMADPDFRVELNELGKQCFSEKSAVYHYLNMAKNNYEEYVKDRAYVKISKYLCVIRPLLSCIYMQEVGGMAPTLMEASLALIEQNKAHADISALLDVKRSGQELDTVPANEVLNTFIEETMFFFNLYVLDTKGSKVDHLALDKLLLRQVISFSYEN